MNWWVKLWVGKSGPNAARLDESVRGVRQLTLYLFHNIHVPKRSFLPYGVLRARRYSGGKRGLSSGTVAIELREASGSFTGPGGRPPRVLPTSFRPGIKEGRRRTPNMRHNPTTPCPEVGWDCPTSRQQSYQLIFQRSLAFAVRHSGVKGGRLSALLLQNQMKA